MRETNIKIFLPKQVINRVVGEDNVKSIDIQDPRNTNGCTYVSIYFDDGSAEYWQNVSCVSTSPPELIETK